MSVTESSGTFTIPTSTSSALATDNFWNILSTDFSFSSDNTVIVPPYD